MQSVKSVVPNSFIGLRLRLASHLPMHNRIRIQITGTVQGVGFRPFIYNLANKYNLKGFCLNDSRGVLIEVQGELIDRFIEEIKTSPPPSFKD